MPGRRRSPHQVASRAVETAWAAPLVIAHRLQRLAAAGANPSARDRQEFSRMGWEKVAAFYESWAAMTFQAWRVQQALWLSMLGSTWRSWPAWPSHRAGERAMVGIVGRGLAPVHRRVRANARRLSGR